MAERRPLVLIDGTPQELPEGDSLPSSSSSEKPLKLTPLGQTIFGEGEFKVFTASGTFTAPKTGSYRARVVGAGGVGAGGSGGIGGGGGSGSSSSGGSGGPGLVVVEW